MKTITAMVAKSLGNSLARLFVRYLVRDITILPKDLAGSPAARSNASLGAMRFTITSSIRSLSLSSVEISCGDE